MMGIEEKTIKILHNLGLTPLQAKIYMVLIQIGKEKIQTIAKEANTDRANTYQAIAQLQKIGLIEKILSRPNFYQALPLEDGISTLLRYKERQYSEIQKQAQELRQLQQHSRTVLKEKEYEFKVYAREKGKLLDTIRNSMIYAQESFDLLLNSKSFCTCVLDLAKDQLGCIRRGVKYRLITPRMNLDSKQMKILQTLIAQPNFQIKFISYTPNSELIIRDKKKVSVTLLPNAGLGEGRILTSDHQGCIEMFQNHFDTIWDQAENSEI